MREDVKEFLLSETFAVAGASKDRSKFGNKLVRCYQQNGHPVIPVNPHESAIEGLSCAASVADLPDSVQSLSIVTPPAVTEQIVRDAARRGIRHLWMQPGAESEKAIAEARKSGMSVIADGTCVLVELGFRDDAS